MTEDDKMAKALKEEANKQNAWDWTSYYKWMFIFFTVMIIGSFIKGSLDTQAQLSYEASLTPAERAQLAEHRAIEKQQADESSTRLWAGIFGLAYNPFALWFVIIFLLLWKTRWGLTSL